MPDKKDRPLPTLDILDINLEELDAYIERERAFGELRKKHSYVGDLIRVLMPLPNGLSRSMVLHYLNKQRQRDGLPIPPTFDNAVQSSYNQHSIDSDVFRKRKVPDSEAIFYSPEGKWSGKWAVNRERAAAWLKARLQDDKS